MEKPFVNSNYVIQKIQGKGGWSYVLLKGMKSKYLAQRKKDNKEKKGLPWVRVSGKVDTYELAKYNLFPMKSGDLFLPIKADIRKAIKKRKVIQFVLFCSWMKHP